MATFIAIVQADGHDGYRAFFPDFPHCSAQGRTLDIVMARAREALLMEVQRLLDAGERLCEPTPPQDIARGSALLLTAVDIPDDIRQERVEIDIPTLSLVRIDSFARRHGLSRAALFVEAVGRWAAAETADAEISDPDGPTLSDFHRPMELKVESVVEMAGQGARGAGVASDESRAEEASDVTSELARLLDEYARPRQSGQMTSDEGR